MNPHNPESEHSRPFERATNAAKLALVVGIGAIFVREVWKGSRSAESITDYAKQRANELMGRVKSLAGHVIDFVHNRFDDFLTSRQDNGEDLDLHTERVEPDGVGVPKVGERVKGSRKGHDPEIAKKALLGEVTQAAKATRVHTDLSEGILLSLNEGPTDQLQNFSYGWDLNGIVIDRDHIEALSFEPERRIQHKTHREIIETIGLAKQWVTPIAHKVPTVEAVKVTNPATGEEEPAVTVTYQFNGNHPDYSPKGGISRPPSTEGPMLFVRTTLPKSIADRLRQAVLDDPKMARKFAEKLALNEGITEDVWAFLTPPYDEIPADNNYYFDSPPDSWELTVTDLDNKLVQGDLERHVTARQVLKISSNVKK